MAVPDSIRHSLPFFDAVQAGVTLLDEGLELIWANRYFHENLEDLTGLCGQHCFAGHIPQERRCEDCLPPMVQRSGEVGETLRTSQDRAGRLSYFRVVCAPMPGEERLLCNFIIPLSADQFGGVDSWRERFLLSAIRTSNDGVFALDRTHTIRFWNRGAEVIFGWRVSEAVGEPVHRMFSAETWAKVEEVFNPPDPLQPVSNRELLVDSRDRGQIWIDVTRTPLVDGSGRPNGNSFVVRDITERKRAQEKMAFTERMTAVGNMAAALAHEIGTPLGVISGNAEIILLDLDDDDPRKEELETIVRETDRIGGLVRELLSFSRPEAPEMEPIHLEEVLRRVHRLIHHASEKQGTRVTMRVEEDLPFALGDANQLEQVILNLSMNALQAVESGGEVTMLARGSCPIGPDGIERSGIELVIQDSGPGLPEGLEAQIFDPFFTTKSNGTGLGLSVCKSLVEKHGGTIAAQVLPKVGTVFTVWLPALDEEGGFPPTTTPQPSPPSSEL